MSENGNGRWSIAFWVMTVLVVGSFTWTTFCSWENQQQIRDLFNRHIELKEVANEALHKIDLRLSRIEDRLGVKSELYNVRNKTSTRFSDV